MFASSASSNPKSRYVSAINRVRTCLILSSRIRFAKSSCSCFPMLISVSTVGKSFTWWWSREYSSERRLYFTLPVMLVQRHRSLWTSLCLPTTRRSCHFGPSSASRRSPADSTLDKSILLLHSSCIASSNSCSPPPTLRSAFAVRKSTLLANLLQPNVRME